MQRIANEAKNGPALLKAWTFLSSRQINEQHALDILGRQKMGVLSNEPAFEFTDQGRQYYDTEWCSGCGEYLNWSKCVCSICNIGSKEEPAGIIMSLCDGYVRLILCG